MSALQNEATFFDFQGLQKGVLPHMRGKMPLLISQLEKQKKCVSYEKRRNLAKVSLGMLFSTSFKHTFDISPDTVMWPFHITWVSEECSGQLTPSVKWAFYPSA